MQALALPELITTARKPSPGVRAIERHRRGEHQILRVNARGRAGRSETISAKSCCVGLRLMPGMHAGAVENLEELEWSCG